MVVTIVIPVSRPDFLHRIFAQLEMMECDKENTHIFVYVDGNIQLMDIAKNLAHESKFKSKQCLFRRKGQPNVGSVRGRRKRIADIHNEVKSLIQPCELVLLLEDDTLFPTNALQRFIKIHSEHPFAGFISGVEIGRWGYEMIGAWKADDIYDAKCLITVPLDHGVQEIDAAGLYCCVVKYDVYKKHEFAPFSDILGPDVNFGLWLRQQGYRNYVDHDMKCKHLTKHGEISFEKANIVQVEIRYTANGWSQRAL